MKIYQVASSKQDIPLILNYGTKNVLISNYYLKENWMPIVKNIKLGKADNTKASLFLDSGAFTAFTQGITIDIKKYIIDLFRLHKYFDIIAALDVIGSPSESYDNYLAVIGYQFSDKVAPVWHSDADVDYIRKYLSLGAKTIAFGKLVNLGFPDRIRTIRKGLLTIINEGYKLYSDFENTDGIKVHLFGVNDVEILKRFSECYSCDSSSWMSGRRYATLNSGNGLSIKTFNYHKQIRNHHHLSSIHNALNDRKTQEYISEYQHRQFLTKTLKLNPQENKVE